MAVDKAPVLVLGPSAMDSRLGAVGAAVGSSPSAADARGMVRVLIVDDSARSRAALRALLSTFPGVEVQDEAADGAEALSKCISGRPDVVLMDVRMPGLNGLQATRLIRRRCPETRIIVLSMYSCYRTLAEAAGAEAFLAKGCSSNELQRALRSPVDRRSGEPWVR